MGNMSLAALLMFATIAILLIQSLASKWWTRHAKGRSLLAKQKFPEAVEEFQTALQEHNFARDDPRRAMLLDGLAQAVKGIGDFADAEPIAREAVQTARAAWGADSKQAALLQVNLGTVYLDLARLEDAERCFREVMDHFLLRKRNPHQVTSFCENNLGVVATLRKDHATAERYFRRAMEGIGRPGRFRSANPGLARSNLCSALAQQNKLEEAEQLAVDAIRIFHGALPKGHLWHALPLSNLAEIRLKQKQLDEAEALARDSVQIAEEALGFEHPTVAKMLHVLVKVLVAKEKWEEAETLSLRDLRLREDYLAPTHPALADSVELYAEILRRRGREEQAADLLGQSRQRQAAFRDETETAIRTGGKWQTAVKPKE